MNSHSWKDTTGVERPGNDVMDTVFGGDYIVVHGTRDHQRQEVDRILIHKRDASLIHRAEYKTDMRAGETGNLALEEVSVRRAGHPLKKGWVHTTRADVVVFYVPTNATIYVITVEVLRKRWADIQQRYKPRTTSTCDSFDGTPNSYETDFYAVPITWLRDSGLIASELQLMDSKVNLTPPRGSAKASEVWDKWWRDMSTWWGNEAGRTQ